MRRNIFTPEEKKAWNDKYIITYDPAIGIICESRKNHQRTIHSPEFGFIMATDNRHVTITKTDIDIWKDHFYPAVTLLDVHDAISILVNTEQEITEENIRKYI
jgi:hypothetical protein